MEEEITTTCPNCGQTVTANFGKTASLLFQEEGSVLRIGFVAEVPHSCNN